MGFLASLFGGRFRKHPERDDVVGVHRDDTDMRKAREQVNATLLDFIKELQSPESGVRYLVKVEIIDGKNVEYVWLEPVKWMSPGLAGILSSRPAFVQNYKVGDLIKPSPRQIADWVVIAPDGSRRGGFTVDAVDKHQP